MKVSETKTCSVNKVKRTQNAEGAFDATTHPPQVLKTVSVAVEMHNTLIDNVASTERTLFKAISMAVLDFSLQPCISITHNNP